MGIANARGLADGEASRLHRALVLDSRVAKDVDAGSDTKEIGGDFTVDATAAEGKSLDDVSRVMTSAFEELKTRPPAAEELARHDIPVRVPLPVADRERRPFAHAVGGQNRRAPRW